MSGSLVGPIKIDPLKEDNMEMEVQIHGAPEALDKRDRSRLYLLPLDAACDRLVHVILSDRSSDDGMNLRRQVLR